MPGSGKNQVKVYVLHVETLNCFLPPALERLAARLIYSRKEYKRSITEGNTHAHTHTFKNTDISDGQNPQRTVLYLDCGNSYLSKLCNKKGEFLLYVHLCLNKPNFQKKILKR